MYRELFQQAEAVMQYAYAPYSNYRVGAALLTKDGRMFTGVNVENSSFGGTICAERVAFSKAIAEGEREFDAIAVASTDGKGWPCGICRQFMYEFAPDLKVIVGPDTEHPETVTLSELLPRGFKL